MLGRHDPWEVTGRTEMPTVPAPSYSQWSSFQWTLSPAPSHLLPGLLPGLSPHCLLPRLVQEVPTGPGTFCLSPDLCLASPHGSGAVAPLSLSARWTSFPHHGPLTHLNFFPRSHTGSNSLPCFLGLNAFPKWPHGPSVTSFTS